MQTQGKATPTSSIGVDKFDPVHRTTDEIETKEDRERQHDRLNKDLGLVKETDRRSRRSRVSLGVPRVLTRRWKLETAVLIWKIPAATD